MSFKSKKAVGIFYDMMIKKHVLFYIAYVILFVSFFIGDIYFPYSVTRIQKYIRVFCYIILCLNTLLLRVSRNTLIILIVLIIFSLFIYLNTKVLLFCVICLFVLNSLDIDNNSLIKTNFYCVIAFAIIVLLLCATGVLEDVLTARWAGTTEVRHSLGFYHSNVLPLLLMYICGYYDVVFRQKKRVGDYISFVIISIVVYFYNDARNPFIITIYFVMCGLLSYLKISDKVNEVFHKIVCFLSTTIFPFLGVISILIPLNLNKVALFTKIDYALSNRFTLISRKINSLGLHLFSVLNTEQFFEDSIVVDNGYAFIAIRYGIIMLILCAILVICLAKKYKNDNVILLVIIGVCIANFVDNDFFDYCCLPFFVIGIKAFIDTCISHKSILKWPGAEVMKNE